MQKDIRS